MAYLCQISMHMEIEEAVGSIPIRFSNGNSRNSYISLKRSRRILRLFALLLCASSIAGTQARKMPPANTKTQRSDSKNGYVGSQQCALCHDEIYEKYSRTDMGRSMAFPETSLIRLPTSASVFHERLNRHFEVSSTASGSTQTEYEMSADDHEVFRETEKIEWTIGAGANGIGGIVKHADYLFEAPLSFYSNVKDWSLSPGYEYADYGFGRPILPGCVSCHSGRAQPIEDGNGRFRNPPFLELAIGCENCHGPGQAHVASPSADTIVNPAKLSGWLADNVCLECHQTGDARVLRPGKDYSDFLPGSELDDTLSIFMVPFREGTTPRDDLLQHYLSMRLSKCYRQSSGILTCITCHDPHQQPAAAEVSAYFRQRCLTCHTEQSCSRPLAERQKLSLPDNCVGCHMLKRNVTVISHSMLTNHRIVRTADEPFPEMAFHMTYPELPDLVYLSAKPGIHAQPSPLLRLHAYREILPAHPEYREAYWKLAKQLQPTHGDDISVLEALADLSLQDKSPTGAANAILYLDRARAEGSTQTADFERLGRLLIAGHQWDKAVEVLKQGIERIPFDEELYRLLTQTYFSANNMTSACKASAKALQLFPQDDSLRGFVTRECESK